MKPGPCHAMHLVLGLTLWFAWFGFTYGGVAVACAMAAPPAGVGPLNWINALVLLVALLTSAGLAWGGWACARAARRLSPASASARTGFLMYVAASLYAIAAVSTVVVALPAVLLPPCV